MNTTKIHYAKPSITDLEVQYVSDAARHGWGEDCYEYIYKFEKIFKDHLGVKYSIATSSCTGALHLGLAAIGIKPGDEVIIADVNWIASVAPIIYLGAKPIFVDILPDTWCIDPEKIEAEITPNTRAIIAVHLYGNLCEMDQIREIGKKYKLAIIEDAAEALGSVYKGEKAGSISDFGVFSFHGTKTITTGEGGMFVTNRKDLYEKVQSLNSHGRSIKKPKQFWCETIGYKYRISNIQAALGYAQMKRIDELIKRKREIFFTYYNFFKEIGYIKMNPIPNDQKTQYGYWMPTIVFDKSLNFDRKKFLEIFKKNNIDARVFFYPLSMMPMFEKKKKNIVSYDIFDRAINLPSYHDMDYDDLIRIVSLIKSYF